jgi:hypothetical protein
VSHPIEPHIELPISKYRYRFINFAPFEAPVSNRGLAVFADLILRGWCFVVLFDVVSSDLWRFFFFSRANYSRASMNANCFLVFCEKEFLLIGLR